MKFFFNFSVIVLFAFILAIQSCQKEEVDRVYIENELQIINSNVINTLNDQSIWKDISINSIDVNTLERDKEFELKVAFMMKKARTKTKLILNMRKEISSYLDKEKYNDLKELENIYKMQFFISTLENYHLLDLNLRTSLTERSCAGHILAGALAGAWGGCKVGTKLASLFASPAQGCLAFGLVGAVSGGLLGAVSGCE